MCNANATNTALEAVGSPAGGCYDPHHHRLYRSQRPFLPDQQIENGQIVAQVKIMVRSEGDKLDHHRPRNTDTNTTQRMINLCRLLPTSLRLRSRRSCIAHTRGPVIFPTHSSIHAFAHIAAFVIRCITSSLQPRIGIPVIDTLCLRSAPSRITSHHMCFLHGLMHR